MLNTYSIEKITAGCDEAGRGCLAGPVVAAAVILPKSFKNKLLDDSKKLSKKTREILDIEIKNTAINYAIGVASVDEIDEINILNASFLAMHRAINKLKIEPELLLIDGNRFNPYKGIKHECFIKGDSKYFSIAAASVLAKNYRDNMMQKLDIEHPKYDWKANKGYPTRKHRDAIREMGASKYHRKSFKLLSSQLTLNV